MNNNGATIAKDYYYPCCKIGCGQEAEYEIRHGEKPEDYTHACLSHIPDLMTDVQRHYIDKLPCTHRQHP